MQIKAEVMKLIKNSTDTIDMEIIGLKSLHYSYQSSDSSNQNQNNNNNTSNAGVSSSSVSSVEFNVESLSSDMDLIIGQNGITYEQLQNIIEDLLTQNNYHEETLKFLK